MGLKEFVSDELALRCKYFSVLVLLGVTLRSIFSRSLAAKGKWDFFFFCKTFWLCCLKSKCIWFYCLMDVVCVVLLLRNECSDK